MFFIIEINRSLHGAGILYFESYLVLNVNTILLVFIFNWLKGQNIIERSNLDLYILVNTLTILMAAGPCSSPSTSTCLSR